MRATKQHYFGQMLVYFVPRLGRLDTVTGWFLSNQRENETERMWPTMPEGLNTLERKACRG